MDRRYLGRSGERCELAAQARDVDVEGVVVDDRAMRPGRLDELAAAHGVARLGGEPSQDPKLGRRQAHSLTAA